MKTLECASFFAGVGGIDLGFTTCNNENANYHVIYANEIDSYPVKTYEMNFNLKVDHKDVKEVSSDPNKIPDFDVMIAGFPCQAFSIAGYRKGFDDEKGRGTLFFELVKIIRDKHPKVVFLENVKNLASHNKGDTLATILDALKQEGYFFKQPQVLNAMDYGNIPQNRERIYIVAFSDKRLCDNFTYPQKIKLQRRITDVIDFEHKLNQKYYYTPSKYKGDIYEQLVEAMDDDKAIYQWRRKYVRKNKSGVIPTLTANMGMGGHNVPLIKTQYGIRKLTPHECFNAQGFPETFQLPSDVSESRLYKQAGNSVCVTVIKRIAEQIAIAYDNTYPEDTE